MNEIEDFLNEQFKTQRDSRIQYKNMINPRKKHGEKCMFYDCNEDCIKSHSISESVLSKLSDNNEVIFPEIDPCNIGNNYHDLENTSKPNVKFKRTQVASAGTYKGFCKKHDNDIFETLDNYGITTQRDIFLQLYRTVCKYYFTNLNIEKTEKQTFGYYYNANPEFERKTDLSLSELKEFLEDILIDFPELSVPIPELNNQSFLMNPWSNGFSTKCQIIYRRLPNSYNFAIENDMIIKIGEEVAHCIFVVLPGNINTHLFAISSPEVIKLLHSHLNSDINILNTIESIMIQDSQFYLPPAIIEKWSPDKLQCIVNDFFFITERQFLEEYDVSIFDELRQNIITIMRDDIKTHELRKINVLPERKSFEERFLIYRNATIKDRQDKLRFTGNKDGKNYPIGPFEVI